MLFRSGYSGHAWSHGLQWRDRLADVEKILNGEENWERTADSPGARYLFWGREESGQFRESPQPWRERARLVAEGEWGAIYDLKTAPPRGAR